MTRLSIGFGGSEHDTAVVIADAERLVVGIEDERLSRQRYATRLADPLVRAHSYCLAAVPAASDASWTANQLLHGTPFLSGSGCAWRDDQFLHALSVWLTSPFERAAVVVLDAAGDWDGDAPGQRVTASLFLGEGNALKPLRHVSGPPDRAATGYHDNSLGDFYEAVTRAIGFGPLQSGKTMALAAYGDDRDVASLAGFMTAGQGFAVRLRLTGADGLAAWLQAQTTEATGDGPCRLPFERAAALAFAAQENLERLVGHLLIAAHQLCGGDHVCLAGSVALNAVLVGKLSTLSPFRHLHVISAPGDSGTAVGAALAPLAAVSAAGSIRRWPWQPFLGVRHPPPKVLPAGLSRRRFADPERLAQAMATELAAGRVIATCVGGSEFGPRALGHRSLLACPYQDGMLARLNQLKSREWFRPVAPMRLAPTEPLWTNGLTMMQVAVPDDPAMPAPRAALHVDRTARLQLVGEAADPWLIALLTRRTTAGRPFLCNTSFNGPGEPLVETPEEAIALFEATADIDGLLIDDQLLSRRSPAGDLSDG